MKHARIIVAVTNDRLRQRLLSALRERTSDAMLCRPDELTAESAAADLILLSTDDDGEALRSIVERLICGDEKRRIPIVAFMSEEAIARHPALTAWTVNGCAALVALVPSEAHQLEQGVAELARRFSSP